MKSLAINGGKPVMKSVSNGWPIWDNKEISYVKEVIESGKWGIGGNKVKEFARKFMDFQHVQHTLPVANGTLAIDLALEALEVAEGDEVIVPDYTFMATAIAVIRRGAKLVLVDIDPDTFCIDPARVINALTEKTKVIIPVHFGGHPSDMTSIMEIAEKYSISVIEDSAHAHGAMWDGKYVGSYGDIGTFSFQASKTLNCGEGGAVVTNSNKLYKKMWSLHNAGRAPGEPDYNHYMIGTNYRISELQAAVLLAQMERLEAQCSTRNRNGAILNDLLSKVEGVKPQIRHPKMDRHGYYLYTFLIDPEISRDTFKKALEAEGVPIQLEYPAIHTLECIRKRKIGTGSYRVSDMIASRSIWLYHHALLGDDDEVSLIAEAIKKIVENKKELIV